MSYYYIIYFFFLHSIYLDSKQIFALILTTKRLIYIEKEYEIARCMTTIF
jgi:hypothetical protein